MDDDEAQPSNPDRAGCVDVQCRPARGDCCAGQTGWSDPTGGDQGEHEEGSRYAIELAGQDQQHEQRRHGLT